MEPFDAAVDRLSLRVQALVADAPMARYRAAQPRHRQAALPALFHLVVQRGDPRVQQDGRRHGRGVRIALAALETEDHQLQVDADLRRGQPYPADVMHGFEHVVDQPLQLLAAEQFGRHRLRDTQQALVTHLEDFPDHAAP